METFVDGITIVREKMIALTGPQGGTCQLKYELVHLSGNSALHRMSLSAHFVARRSALSYVIIGPQCCDLVTFTERPAFKLKYTCQYQPVYQTAESSNGHMC